MSEPVIFQNFGTKAALFAAVVRRAADQVNAMHARLTDSDLPVDEILRKLLDPALLRRRLGQR